MSSDAADSTDTRHEPDQVEPGKGGWDTGGGGSVGQRGSGALQVPAMLCSTPVALRCAPAASWELIKNALWARIAPVS